MEFGPSISPALDLFVQGLRMRAAGRVRSIVLYGSRARGDSRPDSDVDLFLVVDRRDEQLLEAVHDLALDALLEYGVLLSPKVCPEDKLEKMRSIHDPLLDSLARDGKELWTRN